MNNLNGLMEIKLIGKDISPENMKVKELIEIAGSMEESILPIIKRDNPNVSMDDIIISLVNIGDGCVKYRFKSSFSKVALSAFIALSYSIANNAYQNLPAASIEPIKKISNFAKKRNCEVEFRAPVDSEHPIAKITPSTEIVVPELYYLRGETVIYGKVERVGGATPKVVIRISDKETISCDATEELAKKLGYRLYSWVGLSGTAKWNTEDYSIVEFQTEKITEYQETSLSSAMTELSSLIGKYFKDIKDVKKYVNEELRGEIE